MDTDTHTDIDHSSAPASASDWITAPDPATKKAACGKGTIIVVYNNGTFSVGVFRCHRWDCPSCAEVNRARICQQILNTSPMWYAVEVDEHDYVAVQKRIQRAGGVYCAVGGGGHFLVLMDEAVLPGAELLGGEELLDAIDDILTLPPTPHQHRSRHSDGLFPADNPLDDTVHIEKKIVVKDAAVKVIAKLKHDGYELSGHGDGVQYGRRKPKPQFEQYVESPYENEYFQTEWAEAGNVK